MAARRHNEKKRERKEKKAEDEKESKRRPRWTFPSVGAGGLMRSTPVDIATNPAPDKKTLAKIDPVHKDESGRVYRRAQESEGDLKEWVDRTVAPGQILYFVSLPPRTPGSEEEEVRGVEVGTVLPMGTVVASRFNPYRRQRRTGYVLVQP